MFRLNRFGVVFFLLCAAAGWAQPVVIDGQYDPAEWAGAATYSFTVNLPGGSTTAGTLFLKNDANNLYVCMRVTDTVMREGASLTIEFDAPARDGEIGDDDDGIGVVSSVNLCDPKVFHDMVRYTESPCPPASLCSGADTAHGGTRDGNAAAGNDGTYTAFELWHPLASGDGNDISVAAKDDLEFTVHVRFIDASNNFADTSWPAGSLASYTVTP